MYIVDHGSKDYAHDAFGIHIGQEDHLTFLGSSDKIIKLDLVDCRKGSKTLHQKDSIEFSPDPRRCLIIPNGVAHCFSGLENVYTINRPAVCVDNWQAYDSANDVIDWPITNTTYPVLDVTNKYVPQEFYNKTNCSSTRSADRTNKVNTNCTYCKRYRNRTGQENIYGQKWLS